MLAGARRRGGVRTAAPSTVVGGRPPRTAGARPGRARGCAGPSAPSPRGSAGPSSRRRPPRAPAPALATRAHLRPPSRLARARPSPRTCARLPVLMPRPSGPVRRAPHQRALTPRMPPGRTAAPPRARPARAPPSGRPASGPAARAAHGSQAAHRPPAPTGHRPPAAGRSQAPGHRPPTRPAATCPPTTGPPPGGPPATGRPRPAVPGVRRCERPCAAVPLAGAAPGWARPRHHGAANVRNTGEAPSSAPPWPFREAEGNDPAFVQMSAERRALRCLRWQIPSAEDSSEPSGPVYARRLIHLPPSVRRMGRLCERQGV